MLYYTNLSVKVDVKRVKRYVTYTNIEDQATSEQTRSTSH